MSRWIELNPQGRASDLPDAIRRQTSPGVFSFSFVHDDLEIDNPTLDVSGRYFVSPREYGFAIRGFQSGRTAWARDFGNGTMLVVNPEGLSHVLSPKVAARTLFVAPNGDVLYDSAQPRRAQRYVPELVEVRLTLSATFDLHGETPEGARAVLMRMLDAALMAGAPTGETDAVLTEHRFETSTVLAAEPTSTTDTDFSQLLGL
jgi:hypothetical protein